MSECLALTKEEVSCRRSLGRGLDVATVLPLDFQLIPTWFQPTRRPAVSCGQLLTSEPQFTHGWKGAAVALSAMVVEGWARPLQALGLGQETGRRAEGTAAAGRSWAGAGASTEKFWLWASVLHSSRPRVSSGKQGSPSPMTEAGGGAGRTEHVIRAWVFATVWLARLLPWRKQ